MYAAMSYNWLAQQAQFSRGRRRLPYVFVAILMVWILAWHGSWRLPSLHHTERKPTPLVDKIIGLDKGFYIPDHWWQNMPSWEITSDLKEYMDLRNPRDSAEAAHLALTLAMRRKLYMEHTKIPLVIHQTWKNRDPDSWAPAVRESVEEWLRIATGEKYSDNPQMAYILWDDEGIDQLISLYEKTMIYEFNNLPHPVEKADIFRVAVLKWYGGIYADIDTTPLTHPDTWVQADDIRSWSDPVNHNIYNLHHPVFEPYLCPDNVSTRPHPWPQSIADATPQSYKSTMDIYRPWRTDVAAIFGIECDAPTTGPMGQDAYWRMGYSFPVQITNWAFAMAPLHPVGGNYIRNVAWHMAQNNDSLPAIDPLILTGPPALTQAVKEHTEWAEQAWAETHPDDKQQAGEPNTERFRWESLTGLDDGPGGRGKIVAGDVLVLPITAFSPGRGRFHNMGSMGLDHKNARLVHKAQGSWRKKSLRVEVGKACRTLFGLCREWSKVP